jgi:hypothetical protein
MLEGTEDSKEAAKMQITEAMQLWQSSKNEGKCRKITILNSSFCDAETKQFSNPSNSPFCSLSERCGGFKRTCGCTRCNVTIGPSPAFPGIVMQPTESPTFSQYFKGMYAAML